MAAISGAQAGKVPYFPNAEGPGANNLGVPANSAALAGAVTITIPTDAAGNPYKAVEITTSGAVWINFSADSTPATVGGPNCYLITTGTPLTVVIPAGATKVGAIPATGSTTPDVCVLGLY